MTTEEYRAHSAVNYSRLKWMLASPAHYNNPPRIDAEKSVEMTQGTMLHAYVLEGKDIPYVLQPKFDPEKPDEPWHGVRKSCKAWLKEQTLPVLKEEDVEDQIGMRDAVKNSVTIQEILNACRQREASVFANYRGVDIKALLDGTGKDNSGNRVIFDIKTCLDASPSGFAKAVIRRGYLLQMALYSAAVAVSEGLEDKPGWLWIAVENKRPYNVAVYAPTDEHWNEGNRLLDYCIETLKSCREKNEWPGYSTSIQYLPWRDWDSFEPQIETE